MNGKPILTSTTDELSEALVAASLSNVVDRDSDEVEQFLRMLENAQAVRRFGSAALNLCYVAAGRLDDSGIVVESLGRRGRSGPRGWRHGHEYPRADI